MTLYFRLLQRYGLFVLLTGLMGIGLTLWLLLAVIQPTYRSSSSLLVTQQRGGGLSQIVSRLEKQFDLLGPLQNLSLSSGRDSSLQDLVSILRSRSLSESVEAQSSLKQLPEVLEQLEDLPFQEHQAVRVEYLQEQVEILPPDRQDGTLRIQVELKDREAAAEIANLYVKTLRQFALKLIKREQSEQLNYLKKQSSAIKKRLQESEEALLGFQKENDTVALDAEVKERLKALATLEADELSAQAALESALAQQRSLSYSADLAPERSQIRNEVDLTVTGLQEKQASLYKARQRYEQSLKGLPDTALQLARLERNVTLNHQLYLLLEQQTQAAQLDAARQIKLFEVLDPAIPAREPVKPVKGLWLAISGIMSIGLGIVMVSIYDFALRLPKEREDAQPKNTIV